MILTLLPKEKNMAVKDTSALSKNGKPNGLSPQVCHINSVGREWLVSVRNQGSLANCWTISGANKQASGALP